MKEGKKDQKTKKEKKNRKWESSVFSQRSAFFSREEIEKGRMVFTVESRQYYRTQALQKKKYPHEIFCCSSRI